MDIRPGEEAPTRRRVGLFAGPTAFVLVLLLPLPEGMDPGGARTAAVALWMAIWWITEAVPIPATALLPIAAFPILGVADIRAATGAYANPVIYLFLGGFLIARAVQRWELHRRIALSILRISGDAPDRVVGAFMVATAVLSMWVSNTATAIMMMPIGASVVQLAGRKETPLGVALMLAIAYAASIGGIGTLIGTPPNAYLAGFLEETYGVRISFARWMVVAMPITLIMLPLAWLVLTRWVFPLRRIAVAGFAETLSRQADDLGPMSRGEKLTATVFALTAAAWVFRPLLGPGAPSDAGIAILGALAMFVVPVDLRRGVFLLDWSSAVRLPWDVLLLFGGGLSLAGAITRTGLADWLGTSLSGLGTLPLFAMMLAVTLLLIFLTELTSNTATTATFLPVLASLAIGIGQDPYFLVVPAVIAASCAFMLPVATPPNAIVYGSGHVSVPEMARAGIVLNLLFAVAIPLVGYALIGIVLGARAGVVPAWAGG